MKKAGNRRPNSGVKWVLLAILLIAAGYYIRTNLKNSARKHYPPHAFFEVKRGDMLISIVEEGALRALNETVIRSGLDGLNRIIYLAPEGAHVKEGELLVEFDSSGLKDRLNELEVTYQERLLQLRSAQENIKIQKSLSESQIKDAELQLENAISDLGKFRDGDAGLTLKVIEGRLGVLKEQVRLAKERLARTEILFKEQKATRSEFEADQLTLKREEIALTQYEEDLRLIQKYDHPNQLRLLQSKVEQAEDELERLKLRSANEVAQAEADVRTSQRTVDVLEDNLEMQRRRMELTKITAPQEGMVVYSPISQFQSYEPDQRRRDDSRMRMGGGGGGFGGGRGQGGGRGGRGGSSASESSGGSGSSSAAASTAAASGNRSGTGTSGNTGGSATTGGGGGGATVASSSGSSGGGGRSGGGASSGGGGNVVNISSAFASYPSMRQAASAGSTTGGGGSAAGGSSAGGAQSSTSESSIAGSSFSSGNQSGFRSSYSMMNSFPVESVNSGFLTEGIMVRQRQELIRLPDVSRMITEIRIPEGRVRQVTAGLPALIKIDNLPRHTFKGSVRRVGLLPDAQMTWMNPNLKVYPADILIEDHLPDLKPGVTARAEIIITNLSKVLSVPIQTVARLRGNNVCYVEKDGDVVAVPVTTGWFNEEFIEITEGLKAGDKVLLAPLLDESGKEDTGTTNEVGNAEDPLPVAPAPNEIERRGPPLEAPAGEGRGLGPRDTTAPAQDGEAQPGQRRRRFGPPGDGSTPDAGTLQPREGRQGPPREGAAPGNGESGQGRRRSFGPPGEGGSAGESGFQPRGGRQGPPREGAPAEGGETGQGRRRSFGPPGEGGRPEGRSFNRGENSQPSGEGFQERRRNRPAGDAERPARPQEAPE